MRRFWSLVLCISLPLIVGGIAGYFTTKEITGWYATLSKPSFNPPNYLFGPVWTALYLLMGISLYMVLNGKTADRRKSITIFVIQLVLNFLWSIIFFNFHNPGLALAEISLLWVSIIVMIFIFYKNNKAAGLLQLPYLLWVSFASILNASIYYLN